MVHDPKMLTEQEMLQTAVDGLDSDTPHRIDAKFKQAIDEMNEEEAQAANDKANLAWNKSYDELGDG
ncbi:hypothetical protein [Paracoccus simplex]|uniref:Uncharacterized protein n=1 Tax=Paracoccus simplex TaxID=2086346 RepID=A0ABV7S077_9RHOB